ncbi:unnamed protein product [Phytophthora fragariaefolia]|uniref:Unnamed protein product n=1 Tax=Phytophthora fragariaefolia TaxID=1490495 RepID=A0A9W6YAM2_9STRA|nr:unnamed protein product [Phytophthora fragariaefolia]
MMWGNSTSPEMGDNSLRLASTVLSEVLTVEERREKLPAPEVLGTWVPTDETMTLLAMNGELEWKRVTEWVKTLKKEDTSNESDLGIGEMEPANKDLVIALLRQYADIAEKKGGCPCRVGSQRKFPVPYSNEPYQQHSPFPERSVELCWDKI